MPMSFPDSDEYPLGGHLINAGQIHKFRPPGVGESQDEYRAKLADHVESIDFIESCEIRNKVGCDQWDDSQKQDMLRRKGFDT